MYKLLAIITLVAMPTSILYGSYNYDEASNGVQAQGQYELNYFADENMTQLPNAHLTFDDTFPANILQMLEQILAKPPRDDPN
ncbi:AGAP005456-PA-like protein [Anopheles sinensis]|uniref:AGAP005456-PA-like protein n=1 Tax=Anopheles sinensis TaxID=74873 RepID=A0A084W0G3_ANOSI|nr:AGAP005456-PA-like protein [Anopheles sinensis]